MHMQFGPGKKKPTTDDIFKILDEIGIMSAVIPCPMCSTDVAPLRGKSDRLCPICDGDRKLQYGIGDVIFI